MDGVLADVYSQFISFEAAESGIQLSINELLGKGEYEAFKNGRKHVNSPGFFRHAPLMKDCVEAIQLLQEKYQLFIVSAAMEFPNSLPEKLAWLGEHFPFIGWQQIVFCGSKAVVRGDIMIDDHFKNLDHFQGQTLLFTQPHNVGQDDRGHARVRSWKDVLQMLC